MVPLRVLRLGQNASLTLNNNNFNRKSGRRKTRKPFKNTKIIFQESICGKGCPGNRKKVAGSVKKVILGR